MNQYTQLPSLEDHYTQLLGLVAPWTIANVLLDVEKATLDIHLVEKGKLLFPCPDCGKQSRVHDHAPERRWRHLDTMQFTTEIVARLPRITCGKHGVRTVNVPWSDSYARWTLLFERFSIEVLQATSNITRAMALLKIGWDQVQMIRERAVGRGLERRSKEKIRYIGIDEKSFLKGHQYASLMTDLDHGRVLDVVEGRTKEGTKTLIDIALSDTQCASVEAASMDMWQPFMDAWNERSNAPIVHDKFHISKYLGEAVDTVRKQENRTLLEYGDERLKGSRYLFLKNNLEGDEKTRFRTLMREELKVGRAWSLKEAFRHFWDYVRVSSALSFFKRWYFRATHSHLKPLINVAKMLKRHLLELLSHCTHDICNAVTEGLNSKIQFVKTSARGFRSFAHYRIAILFYCGKLDMFPL